MPAPVRTKSIATGVGNTAAVGIEDQLAGGKDVVRKIEIDYADATRYLHHDAHAHAVVLVHTSTTAGEKTSKLTAELTPVMGEDIGYGGEITLPSVTPIVAIELAFSDAAGTSWDSNLSRNYRIDF
jgi:hypothetical protein